MPDCLDRPHDARIGGRQEANQWNHQQGGVKLLASVILDERIACGVESVPAYVVVDPGPERAPSFYRTFGFKPFHHPHRAIDCDHAITFEWVKWRRGPRTSQIPLSGWSHSDSRKSIR